MYVYIYRYVYVCIYAGVCVYVCIFMNMSIVMKYQYEQTIVSPISSLIIKINDFVIWLMQRSHSLSAQMSMMGRKQVFLTLGLPFFLLFSYTLLEMCSIRNTINLYFVRLPLVLHAAILLGDFSHRDITCLRRMRGCVVSGCGGSPVGDAVGGNSLTLPPTSHNFSSPWGP